MEHPALATDPKASTVLAFQMFASSVLPATNELSETESIAGGQEASSETSIIGTSGGGGRAGTTITEGIYEGPDATDPGRTYVGQSENIPRRVSEHEASGKFTDATKVSTAEVKGGKTAREIAEHQRVQELGGVRSKPGSRTSNIRHPIGKKRAHLLKKEEKN